MAFQITPAFQITLRDGISRLMLTGLLSLAIVGHGEIAYGQEPTATPAAATSEEIKNESTSPDSTQETVESAKASEPAPAKEDGSKPAAKSDEQVTQGGEVAEAKQTWLDKVDAFFGTYLVAPMAMVIMNDLGTKSLLGTGIPFIVGWLFIGALFFTIRMGFVNFWGFFHAVKLTLGFYDNPKDKGDVSHFQALASALSGTVGLGNIAGVTIAIGLGGPGATFWIVLVGLLGMTSKFTECALAQMYREFDSKGHVNGGPMQYLKKGFGEAGLAPIGRILAYLFVVLCIGGSFGGGNSFQISQSLDVIRTDIPVLQQYPWVYGLIMTIAVGIVIVGGIKSIGSFTEKLVPVMCGTYVLAALFIILVNITKVPDAISQIFTGAFSANAAFGGFVGVMVIGIKRAVFSNEAGAGSAAIAHSAAKTDIPVREGFVALLEPFIDTVVVCTITALVVVITGVLNDRGEILRPEVLKQELSVNGVKDIPESNDKVAINNFAVANAPKLDKNSDGKITMTDYVEGNRGAFITKEAFVTGGYPWFKWVLYLAVVLFAYSTCISWSYYGERCFTMVFGAHSSLVYKFFFLLFTFLGSVVTTTNILDFSDMMILAMAFPNMIGMYFLHGHVRRAMLEYWNRVKSGEFEKKH